MHLMDSDLAAIALLAFLVQPAWVETGGQQANPAPNVSAELAGRWSGTWSNPAGDRFDLVLELKTADTSVNGRIQWTLRATRAAHVLARVGHSGIESVVGTYDRSKRSVRLEGTGVSDATFISTDQYYLTLDATGTMTGRSRNGGDWSGRLSASKQVDGGQSILAESITTAVGGAVDDTSSVVIKGGREGSARDARGCLLPGIAGSPALRIVSSVPCVQGTNEGYGDLRFTRNGVTTDLLRLSRSTGVRFRGGELRLEWDVADLDLRILECGRDGIAEAVVVVPDSLALHLHWVATKVLDAAYVKLASGCPVSEVSSAARRVRVFRASQAIPERITGAMADGELYCQHNGTYPRPAGGRCVVDGPRAPLVAFRSLAAEQHALTVRGIAGAERVAAEAKSAADSRARADREKNDRIAARQQLLTRYGAVEVDALALQRNPFPYLGKIVAVFIDFRQMRDQSTAVFGDYDFAPGIVAVSAPPAAFTRAGDVLLFGRVVRQSQETVLGTQIAVPLLTFVGVYYCQQPRCTEISP